MGIESPCPEPSELEQFLLGRVDDSRECLLQEHLAHCDRCAARASSLQAEDDLVVAMRQRSPILGQLNGPEDTIIERAREGVRQALPNIAPTPSEVGPY